MTIAFRMKAGLFLLQSVATALQLCAQSQVTSVPPTSGDETITITLQDALARARKYGTQIQAADIAAQLAREDRTQARAAALPSLSALNQFIYTEGNGTPSGVFVANDGVHVYNEQAVVHEDLLSFVRRGEIRLATAAEAVARAKVDVAARGLNLTALQDYYAIASAQRKAQNAAESLSGAQQFLDTAHKQETGGEVAHADVIKAQLQVQQRSRDVQDAQLAVQKAKVNLSVLIFPSLSVVYSIVDDLSEVATLPTLSDVTVKAKAGSPDIRAAQATVRQAQLGVSVARYAYLPSFGLDFWYGIDANQFAAQATGQSTGRSTLPNYTVQNRQNLGYSAAATLTIPIWSWGSIGSKVKQAGLREHQAELDLSMAQKQLQADLTLAYEEAQAAFSQVDSLRSSSELSNESLRLTLLRYTAGEATPFEVVDAQATADQARNAYDDGLVRYRVAIGNLQSLTGAF